MNLVLGEQHHEEHNLNNGTQCGLEQNAKHPWQLSSKLLTRKPDQVGTRNHGDIAECEDGDGEIVSGVSDSDCCGDYRPQDVDSSRRMAARPEAYSKEVPRMKETSSTFTIWMDAFSDSMAIVVDSICGKDAFLCRRVSLFGRGSGCVGLFLCNCFAIGTGVRVPAPEVEHVEINSVVSARFAIRDSTVAVEIAVLSAQILSYFFRK